MLNTFYWVARALPCRLAVRSFAVTDTGRRRKDNEDAVLALPEIGVFAVADGMGGMQNGKVASNIVTDSLREAATEMVTRPDTIAAALRSANRRIHERCQGSEEERMGSTVVVLHIDERKRQGTLFHAGDSRAYRFRNGTLTQVTDDHSLVAELRKRLPAESDEEQLPSLPFIEGQLTRAVGLDAELLLSRRTESLRLGDIYLLCSDGLNRHVDDRQITEALRGPPSELDLSEVAQNLVQMANENGGTDNISVVLVALDRPTDYGKRLFLLAAFAVSVVAGTAGSAAGIARWQRHRLLRALRELKAEMVETLGPETAALPEGLDLQKVLSDQVEVYEKLMQITADTSNEVYQSLRRRSRNALESYRERAKKAVIAQDWAALEGLPELNEKHFPFICDELTENVIDFSQRKAKLPTLWWQLRRSMQKCNFERIRKQSKEYVDITRFIAQEDPVSQVKAAALSGGSSKEKAERLLRNWPFGPSQEELRDCLTKFIEDYHE